VTIYSDKELFKFYDIDNLEDYSRQGKISMLSSMIFRGEYSWSFYHSVCSNDNLLDVSEGEVRSSLNKDHYWLSYGTIRNRSCYSMEELALSFHESDGEFRFSNPDNQPPNDIRPDFPIDSIRKLRTLLKRSYTPEDLSVNNDKPPKFIISKDRSRIGIF
jgi:hypothetical protein